MKLQVQSRNLIGKKVKTLRKEGLIPGVIYSKHLVEATPILFPKIDFLKAFRVSGTSTPLDLKGDGIDHLVLVHNIALHPVTDEVQHVDFLAVRADEKVTAEVSLIIEGVAPVQKNNLGRVQLVKDSIEVEALPKDLPHDIKIDVSGIADLHDVIFVKDLNLGSKVEIKEDPEQPLVTVMEFAEEVEETPVAEVAAEGTEGAPTTAEATPSEDK
jgi:large subunit ribosomal protein L25